MIIDLAAITGCVERLLKVNMGVRAGEHVQVMNDYLVGEQWKQSIAVVEECLARSALARAVYDIATAKLPGNEVSYYVYPSPGRHSAELEPEPAERLAAYPVTVAISNASVSHTVARERANGAGCRIASMPGLIPQMLMPGGPMDADYKEIAAETERLAGLLGKTDVVRVTTSSGTDLTIVCRGRKAGADTGLYDKAGRWGNLPAGEAYIAPVEGQSEGRLVVEPGWYPELTTPMVFEFAKGDVASLSGGGKIGDYYRHLLGLGTAENVARRNMAELGIGTNPSAKSVESLLEAEKIKGTIHIGLGDSSHIGGSHPADFHTDFVVPGPNLWFDGVKVATSGKWAT